jgi:hypothetical protein
MKELYVLVFKESGDILTPDSFKKYWPSYGSNWLSGWRPAKKVYYTLGKAKQGFNFTPDAIQDSLAIAKFAQVEILVDGVELKEKQKVAKEKKEVAREKRIAIYKKDLAERNLKLAQQEYDRVNKISNKNK